MSNSEKSRELLKRYSIARIPFIAINTIAVSYTHLTLPTTSRV